MKQIKQVHNAVEAKGIEVSNLCEERLVFQMGTTSSCYLSTMRCIITKLDLPPEFQSYCSAGWKQPASQVNPNERSQSGCKSNN